MINITFSQRIIKMKWLSVIFGLSLVLGIAGSATAEDNVRGMDPSIEATYFPLLGGISNEIAHNQYGQQRDLSECVVLRRSEMKDGKIHVPAGGLYYASDTSYEARPLMRDPMLILGEHSYLVSSVNQKTVKTNVRVKKGEKELLDPSGYRLWFDYSTDHYEKPYGEFALISPAGGWPHEWPITSTGTFPDVESVKSLNLDEGIQPQLKDFFMTDTYLYGATKLKLSEMTFGEALFSRIEYPTIKEAIFSMDRPYTTTILQETYRWYRNYRIYAFRKETGVLIEVRNWTGKKVLASKLLTPATQQEYKAEQHKDLSLTLLDLDMHIELIVEPTYGKYSDFAPWVNDVPYGWLNGNVAVAIYDDLIKVEDGKPWPRDERYLVRLEANYETGHLQRFSLENKDAFTLDKDNNSFAGPTKISEVWDRKYFNFVIGKMDDEYVYSCYLRDSFYQRTDNMILWKEGRDNVDFFVGMSPLVVSVMEDTFLQRLADPTYGVPVQLSRFTSFPKVIPNSKWFAPETTAAFVPKLNGFVRKYLKNRKKYRLTAAETMLIRGSYVDYRNQQIVIPPGGLMYSTRDSRNVRPGEPILVLGKPATLLRFKSYLVVKKDFRVDFWKEQPMGDNNLLFWQDVPLGDGSKAMRYTANRLLWGRPVAELRLTKYSGNTWGANIMVAHGLYDYKDVESESLPEGVHPMDYKYFIPDAFGEGATYMIPKWVTPDFVEIAEMGTPGMDSFTYTYKKPKKVKLGVGDSKPVGDYVVELVAVNAADMTVDLKLTDKSGNVVKEQTLGPLDQELYDTLPQYAPSQYKTFMFHEDVQVDIDYPVDFSKDKIEFYLAKESQTFERDTPWPDDPRFMIRPDVCGHCYQLNEIILDNKEPIILTEDEPVFEALNGYFSIVIDDFDGEAINAWHLETTRMKKDKEKYARTPNLAEYPRDNVDVMVGVNGTVESFLRGSVLDRLAYRELWRLK